MNDMEYFIPCPCCGHREPILRSTGDRKEFYVYECSRCGVRLATLGEARLSERGARKVWNKRAEYLNYFARANDKQIVKRRR